VGNAGSPEYFAGALGIADAKVWDAPLDRSLTGFGAGEADRRNPNYQIDAYLRETDRRWGTWADLNEQVDQLSSLSLSTATVDGVKSNLDAIKADLQKMGDAQADLDETRKERVQQATQRFTSQVDSIVTSLRSDTSSARPQVSLRRRSSSSRQATRRRSARSTAGKRGGLGGVRRAAGARVALAASPTSYRA
jgi:hypothetical protein